MAIHPRILSVQFGAGRVLLAILSTYSLIYRMLDCFAYSAGDVAARWDFQRAFKRLSSGS